jgi:hypothetical protein
MRTMQKTTRLRTVFGVLLVVSGGCQTRPPTPPSAETRLRAMLEDVRNTDQWLARSKAIEGMRSLPKVAVSAELPAIRSAFEAEKDASLKAELKGLIDSLQ